MDLGTMIDERLIRSGLEVDPKDGATLRVANLLDDADRPSDKDVYIHGVYEREKEFATGIGMYITIPHCKSNAMKRATFIPVRLNKEIDWDSFNGLPVSYIIMLAVPGDGDSTHLIMLSTLAGDLIDDDFRTGLLKAKPVNDIRKVFKEKGEQVMFIVCVTACPVGIVRTHMAVANLEKTVRKVGHEVKMGTQGVQGLEDEITPEDLERADAAIIASDIRTKNGSQFDDVPTLIIDVQGAVKNPGDIIKRLMRALE